MANKSGNTQGGWEIPLSLGILSAPSLIVTIIYLIVWVNQGLTVGHIFIHIALYIGIGLINCLSVLPVFLYPKSKGEKMGTSIVRYLVPFIILFSVNWAYLFFMPLLIEVFSIESIGQASLMALFFSVCTIVISGVLSAVSGSASQGAKSGTTSRNYGNAPRRNYDTPRRYYDTPTSRTDRTSENSTPAKPAEKGGYDAVVEQLKDRNRR